MKNINVVCKRNNEDAIKVAGGILDSFGKEHNIAIDNVAARTMGYDRSFELENVGEGTDLIVILGGDGTLLSASRHVQGKSVPILGVNLGGLGFLTETSVEELPVMLKNVISGDYSISRRIMLLVKVKRGNDVVFEISILNDAVITKDALARIIDIETYINGEYLTTFKADGLIFSTPTGSTGYSMAAGGPLLYPSLTNLIVTPICPHMLTNRPIILPEQVTAKAVLSSQNEKVLLTLDGQIGFPLEYRDEVIVKRSPHDVHLVKSSSKGYFEILRTKLKWGER